MFLMRLLLSVYCHKYKCELDNKKHDFGDILPRGPNVVEDDHITFTIKEELVYILESNALSAPLLLSIVIMFSWLGTISDQVSQSISTTSDRDAYIESDKEMHMAWSFRYKFFLFFVFFACIFNACYSYLCRWKTLARMLESVLICKK
ncbi:hypothetical protein R6Q59_005412 [Mikania micrantha]